MYRSPSIKSQGDGRQDDKGFTLIEILIAIVLVGILSAVAVIGISNLVSKGTGLGVHRDEGCRVRGVGRVLHIKPDLSDQFHVDDHGSLACVGEGESS